VSGPAVVELSMSPSYVGESTPPSDSSARTAWRNRGTRWELTDAPEAGAGLEVREERTGEAAEVVEAPSSVRGSLSSSLL
jgi:hypothetical protein